MDKQANELISLDYTHVHTRQRQQTYAYWQCYSEAKELEIDYYYNKASSHMKVHDICDGFALVCFQLFPET